MIELLNGEKVAFREGSQYEHAFYRVRNLAGIVERYNSPLEYWAEILRARLLESEDADNREWGTEIDDVEALPPHRVLHEAQKSTCPIVQRALAQFVDHNLMWRARRNALLAQPLDKSAEKRD
tara:strand:- start:27289 stop:27657 length:369 start_codon:yes stop_codon:yes gene_type:complete